MLGKYRLQCQKMCSKSSDGRPNNILAPSVFLHEAKNQCMIVDKFCDDFGMIYSVFDPVYFSNILKHEVYAMCSTWVQKMVLCFSSNILPART